MDIFKDKTILLTGGTGSFGNKFSELVLKEHNPHAIRIFSRGEKKQLDMANRFNDDRLRFFIGDVSLGSYPFEEKAIEIHESNADRVKTGLYDEWVKKSLIALRKLRPVRYAKLERSELFDVAIE